MAGVAARLVVCKTECARRATVGEMREASAKDAESISPPLDGRSCHEVSACGLGSCQAVVARESTDYILLLLVLLYCYYGYYYYDYYC